MVEDRFQIRCCYVPHDLVPDQWVDLMISGTFQTVIRCPLHRGKLENLQPMGQAVLYGFLRFIRVANFLVELGNVVGDLHLGLGLCLAGEHFSFLLSVFIEVPDDTLPAAIGSLEYVTVGGQSFFRHLPVPLS